MTTPPDEHDDHPAPLDHPIGAAEPGADPGHPPGTHPAPGQDGEPGNQRDDGEGVDDERTS